MWLSTSLASFKAFLNHLRWNALYEGALAVKKTARAQTRMDKYVRRWRSNVEYRREKARKNGYAGFLPYHELMWQVEQRLMSQWRAEHAAFLIGQSKERP